MRCALEISPGELIDRIAILELKTEYLPADALGEIARSLAIAYRSRARMLANSACLESLSHRLKEVNRELWKIEEALRRCEGEQRFDEHFIQLARRVYSANDKRAALKRAIDVKVGSDLTEPKSYELPEI